MEPITRSEMLMDGQYVEPKTRKEKILAGEDLEPVTREEYFLKKYRHSGGDVDVVQLTATENKVYTAPEGKAYNPVNVNVPEKQLIGLYADENKTYRPSTGYDGFSEVTVDVPTPPPSLQSLTASHNGYFVPSSGYDGFSEVTVDVALPQNAYLLESQKDDVVTIQHGAEFDMPKLIASIEPQQDLHGYDSPWVGGVGKNKLENATSLGSRTINGVTITTREDGSLLFNGTSTGAVNFIINSNVQLPDNTYILSTDTTMPTNSIIAVNTSDGNKTTQDSVTFTGSVNGNVWIYVGQEGVVFNNIVLKPMIRLASVTDATFAPYSNICPISGWDECNASVVGDTQITWDANSSGKYIGADGAIGNSENFHYTNLIPVDEIGIYKYTSPTTGQFTTRIHGYDSTGTWVKQLGFREGINQIIGENTILFNMDSTVSQIRISQSTTVSNESLQGGKLYTIDLDGTRYGGKLDVVSGVLTVDRAYVDMGTLTYTYDSVYRRFASSAITNLKRVDVRTLFMTSTCYKCMWHNESISDIPNGSFYNSNNESNIYIHDLRFDNATDLKNALSGQKVVYPLATPLTIQLTPTQVSSLLGVNNIFADTGEVDVQIWTKEV